MKNPQLPQTDSIQELAKFWDDHDITDFENELEEVKGTVFQRDTHFSIRLESADAQAVHEAARSMGVADSEIIRQWVLEKIHAR